jgi:hypothetical protein
MGAPATPYSSRERSSGSGDALPAPSNSTRVVLITEDEPLFGPECMSLLLHALPDHVRPVLAVLVRFSPAGSRHGRWRTVTYLLRAFGIRCLLEAVLQYACHVLAGGGRWVDVARRVRQGNIDLIGPVSNVNGEAALAAIRRASPDLLLSFSMNGVFGAKLLAIAPCMNLHLSLLPRHRGLMPVFWALHDGDTETGVTVHYADGSAGVDGGAIIIQRRLAISERRLVPLYRALKRLGMLALADAASRGRCNISRVATNEAASGGLRKLPDRDDVLRFRRGGNHEF